MSTPLIVVTKIIRVESKINSPSGNPRFTVITERGTWDTEADGAVNYDVSNYAPHHLRETPEVEVTLNGRNQISHIREHRPGNVLGPRR